MLDLTQAFRPTDADTTTRAGNGRYSFMNDTLLGYCGVRQPDGQNQLERNRREIHGNSS